MNPLTPAFHQRLHRLLAPAFLALSLLIAVGTPRAADAPAAKADPVVGRWRWVGDGIVTILPDGTASSSGGTATWSCTSKARPPTYVLNWKDGLYIDTLHLVKGGKELNGKNAQGQPIIATRLPDLPTK